MFGAFRQAARRPGRCKLRGTDLSSVRDVFFTRRFGVKRRSMERGGAVSPRAVSQPEKQEKTAMPPVIDPEKCIACGTCAQICPDEVFRLERERGEIPVVMYPDEC